MVDPKLQSRTREALDSLMSLIRPGRLQRRFLDVDYQMNDLNFVISVFRRDPDQLHLTQQPCFKAVKTDAPDGWLLFVPDNAGHWVADAEQPFAATLPDVMQEAMRVLPADLAARQWLHQAS